MTGHYAFLLILFEVTDKIITHAVARVGVFTSICLCVLLFSLTISKKPMQLGSPNETEMFHDGSWKPIYFRDKGQGHESQNNIAGVGLSAWRLCLRSKWRCIKTRPFLSLHSCECWLLLR